MVCRAVGECVQRSCSDLRSGERSTATTNIVCDHRELIIPHRMLGTGAPHWSLRCCSSTATPAALVEIIRPSRSPSDASGAGPPWTDSAVRRTKDSDASAAEASRRTGSFPADVELTACRQRTCGRRRCSGASPSSPSSQNADPDALSSSSSTVRSADNNVAAPRRHVVLTSHDYDHDVTDHQLTSDV